MADTGHGPLADVKRTTKDVVDRAQHVRIDDEAVARVAGELASEEVAAVDWDEDGWHYSADASAFGPLTAQYIFVLDALNFCFWPADGYEYDSLAIGLKRALEADSSAFDANRLASVDEATVEQWMGRSGISQLDERAAKLRELGHALEASFDGLAFNLLRAARGSAAELVRLITAHFPGFRDIAVHRGRQVFLYKRAQILAADVWAAYGRRTRDGPPPPGPCSPEDAVAFHDIAALTMFADYRVPQLLRPMGVLCYSDALAATVDARRELPAGSEEEVEIRAATVQAVERLREELQRRGRQMAAVELDWLLWQRGERMRHSLPPHHRTLSCFY